VSPTAPHTKRGDRLRAARPQTPGPLPASPIQFPFPPIEHPRAAAIRPPADLAKPCVKQPTAKPDTRARPMTLTVRRKGRWVAPCPPPPRLTEKRSPVRVTREIPHSSQSKRAEEGRHCRPSSTEEEGCSGRQFPQKYLYGATAHLDCCASRGVCQPSLTARTGRQVSGAWGKALPHCVLPRPRSAPPAPYALRTPTRPAERPRCVALLAEPGLRIPEGTAAKRNLSEALQGPPAAPTPGRFCLFRKQVDGHPALPFSPA
jgi:hypothetical protein